MRKQIMISVGLLTAGCAMGTVLWCGSAQKRGQSSVRRARFGQLLTATLDRHSRRKTGGG